MDRAAVDVHGIVLVVVDVAADRRDVVVGRIAHDVVDREVAVRDAAGMALVVDVERLPRQEDLRLRPGRHAAEPIALVAVEVADDARVDTDETHRPRVDRPVRARQAQRLPG